jgi:hypothetical protein
MRFIVCGGRDYNDKEFLFNALDKLHDEIGIDCVIEGGANGADSLAREWAKIRRISWQGYRADWAIYGKIAGPVRNSQMISAGCPDGVVAFPRANGEIGCGTLDMVTQARAAGLKVWFPETNSGG